MTEPWGRLSLVEYETSLRRMPDRVAETIVAMERFGRTFREYAVDEETRRMASVLRQRQDGRNCGGPLCPVHRERHLVRVAPMLYECRRDRTPQMFTLRYLIGIIQAGRNKR